MPVIAAKGSCLEEAGGIGSIYVDPDDSTDLATQIQLLLANQTRKQKMISDGYEHLKNLEDEKIAEQLMSLYNNILNNA